MKLFLNLSILLTFLIINTVTNNDSNNMNNYNILEFFKLTNILIDPHNYLESINLELDNSVNHFNLYILMVVPHNCDNIMFDIYKNDNKTLLISNVTIEYNKFVNREYLDYYDDNNFTIFKSTNPVMILGDDVIK